MAKKSNYQKRHYEHIAHTIKIFGETWGAGMDTKHNYANRMLECMAECFSDDFAEDNELFDKDRFLAACGFER